MSTNPSKKRNLLSFQMINKIYEQLISQINQWDHEYYVLDNPSVTDTEYDASFRQLQELEANYPEFITPSSPSQRVGAKPIDEFCKIKHQKGYCVSLREKIIVLQFFLA